MRITSSAYYNNIYGDNNKLSKQLFDVNKQISSGLKIQYAHEDPNVFIDTLRLDDEITTLTQIKNSAQSAYKFSTQTDTTIGEMVKTLESMKVKMVNAANGSHSDTSIQALTKELKGLKQHLLTLANTSIGGQYLFSGTATSQKSIDNNGIYLGNSDDLQAFLGSGVKQKYNITGQDLFLGEEGKINRTITTNLSHKSLTDLYPDIMQNSSIPRDTAKETYISGTSSIRDLMGDIDDNTTNNPSPHFYLQGTKSNGETFKKHISSPSITMNATVNDLITVIQNEYGNDQVDISVNANGQIEIIDKIAGKSKLDFHMVGAVDFKNDPLNDNADVASNIDLLQLGTTNFQNVIDYFDTSSLDPNKNSLYIKEFTKSGLETPTNIQNTIEGIHYDRTNFFREGAKLSSNVSQIVKFNNSLATAATKLIDVSGHSTLAGTTFNLEGTNINGENFSITIGLGTSPAVSGTINSIPITPFDIYNANTSRSVATADEITYQQLLDVVNMVMSGTPLPSSNTVAQYDSSIIASNEFSSTTLDHSGKMVFQDKINADTQASLSLYDDTSNDYTTTSGSALTFNTNSALSIRDPKVDFFAQIDLMIQSVEDGKLRPNGSEVNNPRNIGIQNSIQMLDDLSEHVSRLQTEAGSYSQVLQASSDRSSLLIISTKTLQSDVIDTDIAEATLRMQQLSLNYQALLSNISKVSKLSLVNYL